MVGQQIVYKKKLIVSYAFHLKGKQNINIKCELFTRKYIVFNCH